MTTTILILVTLFIGILFGYQWGSKGQSTSSSGGGGSNLSGEDSDRSLKN